MGGGEEGGDSLGAFCLQYRVGFVLWSSALLTTREMKS